MSDRKCATKTCETRVKEHHHFCWECYRKVKPATMREVFRAERAWRSGRLSSALFVAALEQARKEAGAA